MQQSLRSISAKKNLQIVLVQIAATALLVIAAKRLFLLSDVEVVEYAQRYGIDNAIKHFQQQWGDKAALHVTSILLRDGKAALAAILMGCLLSALSAWRWKRTWLLPLYLLSGSTLLMVCGFYTLIPIGALNKAFALVDLTAALLVEGGVLVVMAFLLFFNRRINGLAALTQESN